MRSLLGGLSASTLGAVPPAWSQTPGGRDWMWQHSWGWGFGGGLGMIVFWAVIILLIVLVVRGIGGSRGERPPAANSALQILQERFARGEIDRTEYEERRKTLVG